MNTLIFLGYGVFEESNQEYRDYLDTLAKYVLDHKIDKLILCGGYSNPAKNISEAESFFNYLNTNFHLDCQIILENKSLTTPENLQFSAQYLNPLDNLTVFCDLYRLAKVVWLASYYFLHKSKSEILNALFDFRLHQEIKPFVAWNLTVVPYDFPSRTRYDALGQTFSTLFEVEGIYDLQLGERVLNQRQKDFGTK